METLTGRPRGLTVLAYGLGVVAVGLSFRYLQPPEDESWLQWLAAVAVVAVPLAARPPMTGRRVCICAVTWVVMGFFGGYAFGVGVYYAGLLLGLGLVGWGLLGTLDRSDSRRSAVGSP